MEARHYAPSAWLQLSQLHTLRGVDLTVVSMATIAAALPRLHTLGVLAYSLHMPAAAVAGFVEDLLPRLHVFEYLGWWPKSLHSEATASVGTPPLLPRLRNLRISAFGRNYPPRTWFLGARPLALRVNDVVIERWLPPEDGGGVVDATAGGAGLYVTPLEPPSLFTSTSFFDARSFGTHCCCRAALQCVVFFVIVVALLLCFRERWGRAGRSS
jgi:hypothetical protein